MRLRPTFGDALRDLSTRHGGRHLFVVVDANLMRRNPKCLRGLPLSARRSAVALRGGESCKSLTGLERLYREARRAGVDRHSLVVAVGGGTIGDLTGFFAATWMRGVAWAVVATTPLAMADSALGGKTAVDWGGLKNPVGAFHPPVLVFGVREALSSLPARHRRAGLAEVLKSAIIGSRSLYRTLGRVGSALSADPEHEAWEGVLRAAAAVKSRVVREDPYEMGPRALLNFGHSFGHALELSHRPSWLHGEAVGVGMLAAVELSHRKGLCDGQFRPELAQLLHGMGLPTRVRGLDQRRFWAAFDRDKKGRSGRVRLVLTEGPGSATFGHAASRSQLEAVLRTLRT